jgi:hypothetical protein
MSVQCIKSVAILNSHGTPEGQGSTWPCTVSRGRGRSVGAHEGCQSQLTIPAMLVRIPFESVIEG